MKPHNRILLTSVLAYIICAGVYFAVLYVVVSLAAGWKLSAWALWVRLVFVLLWLYGAIKIFQNAIWITRRELIDLQRAMKGRK